MSNFDDSMNKFCSIVSLISLVISFTGLVVFIKTIFFCIKRYILSAKGINQELTNYKLDQSTKSNELSPAEIVKKNILKEKINKFARDTSNIVKSNNYLTERKEDVVEDDYKKEMEVLKNIYVMLDNMEINSSESLEEVEFLFNNGNLRSDDEIESFYESRSEKQKQKNYKKNGFIFDLIREYQESEISTKLIGSLSAMFISGMYFYYKVHMDTILPWTIKDVFLFIIGVIKVAFNPYYSSNKDCELFPMGEYAIGTFPMSLILSTILSFLFGMGSMLIVNWSSNIELHKIYDKAGEKKKPDILLGVNTASYLYVLHKLLKRK